MYEVDLWTHKETILLSKLYMPKLSKKQFEQVQELAKTMTRNAVAKELGFTNLKFTNALVETSAAFDVALPAFAKGVRQRNKNSFDDEVRAVGNSGKGRRILIDQEIFNQLGWERGTPIRIKAVAKKKISIERISE